MKLISAVLMHLLPLALTGAAHATQSISCSDMKGDSGVDILLGAGPVPNVLAVSIALGGRLLTTEPTMPGEKMALAQAYDDGEIVRIDLMDDQVTRRVAIIRLVRSADAEMQLGFVEVDGEPPVGVTCLGP
ncbi:MAG: hypothetical protein Q8K28_09035 [Hoeflea sp.]|uniref:hypothetical protein n=1 Tax=Hoeflea sp. TaxID=1940281 RepID=UPI00272FBD75|nr:hypothetical protein [Hoeflea sp.]MDP2120034.1 hypothetical protein [Hoeflea sp.]